MASDLTDAELNQRVARSLGWREADIEGEETAQGWLRAPTWVSADETHTHTPGPPPFATNLNAAWVMMERMRGRCPLVEISDTGGGAWFCGWGHQSVRLFIDPNPARAICLAYLQAVEESEPDHD